MASPAPAADGAAATGRTPHDPRPASIGVQERAVLTVLLVNRNRVVGRRELARQAGLTGLNERRCDSLLVGLRRALGPGSVVTVRSRGWMLSSDGIANAMRLLDTSVRS